MGTIRRRGDAWQLRIANGTDPLTGRRRTIVETFHGSEMAARIRLAELVNRTSGRHLSDNDLRHAINAWRAEAGHELGTARNYDLAMRTVPARLLGTKVRKIGAQQIAELVTATKARHNVHRARVVHALISGALTYAWRMEWITDNPARRVKLPPAPKRRKTQPSAVQVRALLALVVEDPQLYAWLLLSADLGSRRGETLALRWSNIRLEAREVFIATALDPIDFHEKTTKTDQERTVAISNITVTALRSWRTKLAERALAAGVALDADPYVLSDTFDGSKPWRPDLATKRFASLRKRAGLGTVRLYDMRHFVATELLAAGIPTKTAAGRLGHSRESMLTDTYAAVLRSSDRAAADLMGLRLVGD